MSNGLNAVELTVDHAWFIAETIEAGTFPWVLAITAPYSDAQQQSAFFEQQRAELREMGLVSEGGIVNAAVASWIKVVCFADRWLELRYVGPAEDSSEDGGSGELLRGLVAQRSGVLDKTVVALRSAQVITFTVMDITDARALVPVLGAGLQSRPPAQFDEFRMPMRVGERADQQLRSGASLSEVLEHLQVPQSARPVVEAVFEGPRSYVEIAAGCRRDSQHTTTEVGMSIVDTAKGRILVSPSRAFDGEWISTFEPGTPFATAVALEQLVDQLPDSQWFLGQQSSRDFST